MTFDNKPNASSALVGELATRRGISKQNAVERAVLSELDRLNEMVPLRERFEALRSLYPRPAATGEPADKAFFDDLSGAF